MDQYVGAQIDLPRPDDGAMIHTNLGERGRVGADYIENGADKVLGHVPLDNLAVGEGEPQPMPGKRFNLFDPNKSHRLPSNSGQRGNSALTRAPSFTGTPGPSPHPPNRNRLARR